MAASLPLAQTRKILAGPRLRRLRRERRLTQAQMADELAVSPSYLNLMERNQRPITVPMLVRLTDVYGIDPREFMEDVADAATAELERVLADPLFRETPLSRVELQDAADYAPALVAAIRRLYRAYTASRDAQQIRLVPTAHADAPDGAATPADRVRDIIQASRNYFAEVDELAETFASDLSLDGHDLFHVMAERLRARHGIRVRLLPADVLGDRLHHYDLHHRQLLVSELVDGPGRTFRAAYQLAISEHGQVLNAIGARLARDDDTARRLLRVALANYFAAAVMMPYARFRDAAESVGYDLEVLAARFNSSFEQVAHRVTSLNRPTARGIPMFLLRVDPAGTVSKRIGEPRMPFAQTGGNCALWNVHETFSAPGRVLTQVLEMPEGTQWFSIARTVSAARKPHGMLAARFAVVVGCELKYAHRLAYARRLDLNTPDATPVGLECRLCDRAHCPQRSASPGSREDEIDDNFRGGALIGAREA